VLQDNAFYGHRCRADGGSAEQRRHNPENKPTDRAKVVAPASAPASRLQLSQEQRSVPFFMGLERLQLVDDARAAPARYQNLSAIDVDGAVFAGVIDAEVAVARLRSLR
jgi:hypothetical protein